MKFKWIPDLRIHPDLEPAQSSLSLRLSLDMFHWSRPSCKNLSTCHHSQANQPITGSASITGTRHPWLHFGPTRFQFSTIEPTCRTSRTPSPSPSPAGCCGTRAAASQCHEGQAAEGLRSEGTSRPNRNKVNQTVVKWENDCPLDMWATKKTLYEPYVYVWILLIGSWEFPKTGRENPYY